MAEKEYILTPDGKEALERELDTLKNVTRDEIAKKIGEALSFGDLSENSEYDAAKEEQGKVEARIANIEYMLKHARVVEDDGLDIVAVGKTVTVEYIDPPRGLVTYSIVGSTEADPYKKKLSFESPIGAAIHNHRPGEVVSAAVPAGTVTLKIVSISR